MKKIAMLTLAATLSLGSCAGTTSITPATIQSAVTQVQQATVAICGVLPFANVALATLSTVVPGAASIDAAIAATANQLCMTAVSRAPSLGVSARTTLRASAPIGKIVDTARWNQYLKSSR
jgi:hypothetical protein